MKTKPNAYLLSYDYGDYSHREVVGYSSDYNFLKEEYNNLVQQSVDDEDIDCIELESIIATFTDDGSVDDIIDYVDVVDKHLINEETN